MGNIFNDDFRDFLQALNKCNVEYVLVGGMAVVLHGYVRNTGDMDVWVNRTKENYSKIVKAFLIFGMPIFGMTEKKFLNEKFDVWTFGRSPVRIDLMTAVKGLNFEESYKSHQIYEEEEISIKFIHIDNLMEAKKAAGRHKDLNDIEQLKRKKNSDNF